MWMTTKTLCARHAALVLGPVLAAAVVLSCRGILGIDEDVALVPAPTNAEAGPLDDRGARTGESGTTADATADAPVGFDAAFDAGAVPVDRRYAVWPLPAVKPLLSNYDLTPDTVTDKTTGLVWQRSDASPPTGTYGGGVAYCKGLTLGGQTGWRLPTRIELLTILDYGQLGVFLNQTVFVDVPQPPSITGAWTESKSLLRAKLTDRYTVDVSDGFIDIAPNDYVSNLIRCVRGGPTTSPVARYDAANGAARDVRTGFVWQVTPLATTMLLADAKLACANLALGGTSGWRLPNVKELASLIDEAREVAPLMPEIFQPGPTARFWSDTTRANPPTANFAVDFATANIHQEDFTTEKRSVRCVR
jgi:hypothetical protein